MAKAIFRVGGGGGFLAGRFDVGKHGGAPGSVRRIVHDGDTVNVSTANNFPIRFLGIDTPEISFMKPGTRSFAKTDDPIFERLLADPFAAEFAPIERLERDLYEHIASRATPGAARNHHMLAEAAEDALEALILEDAATDDAAPPQFFLAFAYEALDYYGRLLAYLHPLEPDTPASERKKSYNERMLATGYASPYFIFPNVDPFRAEGSPIDAAFAAASPQQILEKAPALREARAAVAAARAAGLGIFAPDAPLLFEAFELRFLARRSAPTRWLIDLSGDDAILHPPQAYPDIPNAEDRLWTPEAFAPLFEKAGWRLAAALRRPI